MSFEALPEKRLMFGYLMIQMLNSAEYQSAKASNLHTSSKRNIAFELFRLRKPAHFHLFHLKKHLFVIRHHPVLTKVFGELDGVFAKGGRAGEYLVSAHKEIKFCAHS